MWRPDMWLKIKAPKAQHVVHLGQRAVTLFTREASGRCSLIDAVDCSAVGLSQCDALAPMLARLQAAAAPGAALTFLCDSKWLPVTLLNTGARPLSDDQVLGLAKHRFEGLYGARAAQWTFDTDYRAGWTHALSFGLPHELLAVLTSSRASKDPSPLLVQPTLAWAWNHLWRKASLSRRAWLALNEQDRSVLMFVERGRVRYLEPASHRLSTPDQVRQEVRIAANRFGITDELTMVWGFDLDIDSHGRMASQEPWLTWHSATTQGEAA